MNCRRRPAGVFLPVLLSIAAGCAKQEAAPATGAIEAAAHIAIEPAFIELTADGGGTQREVVCRIINHGRAEARVAAVRTACACTTAEPLRSAVLGPRGSMSLKLHVTLPGRGRRETIVTAVTEPPSETPAVLRLVLAGTVETVPRIVSFPRELRLVGRRPGEPLGQAIEVGTVEKPGTEPWVRGFADLSGDIEVAPDGPPIDSQQMSNIPGLPSSAPLSDDILRTYRFVVRGRTPDRSGPTNRFSFRLATATPTEYAGSPPVVYGSVALEPPIRVVPDQVTIRRADLRDGPVARRVMVITDDDAAGAPAAPEALPNWLTVRPAGDMEDHRVRLFEVSVAEPPLTEAERTVGAVPFSTPPDGPGQAAARLTVIVVP